MDRELLAKMTELGGKRYVPNSMVLSHEEWQAHFGSDVWRRLSEAKQKYDPKSVLSPEPAMFSDQRRLTQHWSGMEWGTFLNYWNNSAEE